MISLSYSLLVCVSGEGNRRARGGERLVLPWSIKLTPAARTVSDFNNVIRTPNNVRNANMEEPLCKTCVCVCVCEYTLILFFVCLNNNAKCVLI